MNAAEWWLALDRAGFRVVWVLLSVLWQSSILLAAAGALAYCLRRGRAAVRHAVWAGAILACPLIPLLAWMASAPGAPRAGIPVVPRYSPPAEPAGYGELAALPSEWQSQTTPDGALPSPPSAIREAEQAGPVQPAASSRPVSPWA